jgi:hypothetical protein
MYKLSENFVNGNQSHIVAHFVQILKGCLILQALCTSEERFFFYTSLSAFISKLQRIITLKFPPSKFLSFVKTSQSATKTDL